jgi:hypothetical protein
MNTRLIEMRQLVQQLGAELDTHVNSRPRTFDAGLVAAQLAVETLSRAFAEEGFDFTAEVSVALRDIEVTLTIGQGKSELNRARDLFRQIRGPLAHGDPDMVTGSNLNRYLGVYMTEQAKPPQPSRRTRCATDLAVRLLSPVHRQRYRQEWAAELVDLPRCDQAPYAFRLLSRGWLLRRELSEKPSRAPSVGLAVMVVVPGADALAALCGLDWPAAIVGVGWTIGLAWVVSSRDRTKHLVTLIRVSAIMKLSSEGRAAIT